MHHWWLSWLVVHLVYRQPGRRWEGDGHVWRLKHLSLSIGLILQHILLEHRWCYRSNIYCLSLVQWLLLLELKVFVIGSLSYHDGSCRRAGGDRGGSRLWSKHQLLLKLLVHCCLIHQFLQSFSRNCHVEIKINFLFQWRSLNDYLLLMLLLGNHHSHRLHLLLGLNEIHRRIVLNPIVVVSLIYEYDGLPLLFVSHHLSRSRAGSSWCSCLCQESVALVRRCFILNSLLSLLLLYWTLLYLECTTRLLDWRSSTLIWNNLWHLKCLIILLFLFLLLMNFIDLLYWCDFWHSNWSSLHTTYFYLMSRL